ncbi:MAG: hypothetical protein WC648_02215 [Candidatus Paceibacterota bacterium]|jgi:hypothetical protein
MRDVPKILQEIKKLQNLRNDVPTFVYFGGIGGINVVSVRKSLQTISSHGEEIDVILQSGGGQADDAYRLIRTFREKYETVNVVIPFWAKSAATIFAFGASRIVLNEFGELGPIDVQVKKDDDTDPDGQWSSALNVQASLAEIEARSRQGMLETFNRLRSKEKGNGEILKIGRKPLAEMLLDYSAKFYQPLLQKVETIELGTMTRSLNVGRMYTKRILKQYAELEDDKISKLIDFLAYDCPDHGYVVDYNILKSYLPDNVIKSSEAPFSEQYNKDLETLSIHLMMADDGSDNIVGFLNTLLLKEEKSVIINPKHNEQTPQSKPISDTKPKDKTGNGGGLDNKSIPSTSAKDFTGGNKSS